MLDSNKPRTLDQLLRQRAIDEDQTALFAFPRLRDGITDFEGISGAVLNRFVDGAAKCLIAEGFPPVDEEVVIGMCAPTDLDYVVNVFALVRLGYTVFQLSQRLAPSAIKELLGKVSKRDDSVMAPRLLYATAHSSFNRSALADLQLQALITRPDYDHPQHAMSPEFQRHIADLDAEAMRRCVLMHSSGSTGLPKPIDIDNRKLMAPALYALDATAFISAPFSHMLGMNTYMQAIHKRRTMYALSGYVPQTHDTLTAAIKDARPDVIWTVPYMLKLLAEKQDGIDAMKGCRFVSSGGSKLPDELGDALTDAGVHVGLQFGSTETGLILSSVYRPRSDKAWAYMRPPPHVLPYITFQPIGENKFECVILDGHKAKVMSNSDDPPNSWHTSDIFEPHPTIPNAWKSIGRLDDRITLLNGEKVLPVSIEGRIRQHALVREAVVFGIDREIPGLLIFRASGTKGLSDEEFLDQVWPTVEYANGFAEAFSQITREMIAIIDEDVEYPLTDKSSIKRGLVYREFASVIEAVYAAAETGQRVQNLQLSVPELEAWIVKTIRTLGCFVEDPGSDFFSAGMDSLQAINVRSLILKNIDLGGHDSELASMVVFDCGNAERLARRLHALRMGADIEEDKESAVSEMEALILKYSDFADPRIELKQLSESSSSSLQETSDSQVIILTGATGFLGAHILAALVESSSVSKIYTLLRPSSDKDQTASARLEESLQSKGFNIPLQKVTALYHTITTPTFALEDPALYQSLQSETTHIIHCAWSVNFAIPLSAFEPQLLGLSNLISFASQTSHKARLLFCSSISVAQATPTPALIPSAPIPSLTHCAPMGYAQSKMIAERIMEAATRKGVRASVLRIGQIIPGRRRGSKLWNPSEALPLVIRSAGKNSAGALPVFDKGRDACSWIEADTLADTILQLAGIGHTTESVQLVYNLVNPRVFSWKDDLLPALRYVGLQFETVGWTEWLARLEVSIEDANLNPSRKLLGFWSKQTPRDGDLTFDTASAEGASSALRAASRAVDDNLVKQIIDAWRQIGAVAT